MSTSFVGRRFGTPSHLAESRPLRLAIALLGLHVYICVAWFQIWELISSLRKTDASSGETLELVSRCMDLSNGQSVRVKAGLASKR